MQPLWRVERDAIIEALEMCQGNRTKTAQALEISLRSLRIKIRQYQSQGIEIAEADGKFQYGTYGQAQDERPPACKVFEGAELL